eukprot:PhF_6_TR31220/c0_g1_i1/m.45773
MAAPSDVFGDQTLWLGPAFYSKDDWDLFITTNNIKRIVRVLSEAPLPEWGLTSELRGSDFQLHHIPLDDTQTSPLTPHLPEAIQFLKNSLHNDRVPTYVHCHAGVSRSVSVVAAFMVAECQVSLREALERIRQARPFANPNVGFLAQLSEFEKSVRGGETSVDVDEEYLVQVCKRYGKQFPMDWLRGAYHSPECGKSPYKLSVLVMQRIEDDDYCNFLFMKLTEMKPSLAFQAGIMDRLRDVYVRQCNRNVDVALETLKGQ